MVPAILPHLILNERGFLQISFCIFLPFSLLFGFVFFPPAFHSQKLVCQTEIHFLWTAWWRTTEITDNLRSDFRGKLKAVTARWRENVAHHFCDTGGGCKLEFRGALCHISSSSRFCKRQRICSFMLVQGARYLLRVLFVKLEKGQALKDGKSLNFSGFVFFFIEIQNLDDVSYQFLTLEKKK